MNKKFEVIIEKAEDQQLYGRLIYWDDLLTTNAKIIEKVIINFCEQLDAFYNLPTTKSCFDIKYDIASFLDQFNVLNIVEIGKMANIRPSVMKNYKAGIKYPTIEHVLSIENSIHNLANQLKNIKFV